MIIPVRCFTCGKVIHDFEGGIMFCLLCVVLKVIGNKWDTYLTLLHQEYSERSGLHCLNGFTMFSHSFV